MVERLPGVGVLLLLLHVVRGGSSSFMSRKGVPVAFEPARSVALLRPYSKQTTVSSSFFSDLLPRPQARRLLLFLNFLLLFCSLFFLCVGLPGHGPRSPPNCGQQQPGCCNGFFFKQTFGSFGGPYNGWGQQSNLILEFGILFQQCNMIRPPLRDFFPEVFKPLTIRHSSLLLSSSTSPNALRLPLR